MSRTIKIDNVLHISHDVDDVDDVDDIVDVDDVDDIVVVGTNFATIGTLYAFGDDAVRRRDE